MSKDEIRAKVAEALNVDPSRVNDDSKATDLEDWDSMGTMAILVMLDRDYGLKLPPNQTERLTSIAGIMELLHEAGKL